MYPTLTFEQAAARFFADPAAATWEAVDAAARAARFTGAILGPPAVTAQPGAITAGTDVHEYRDGAETDRYITLRVQRGHVVWVALKPAVTIGQQAPNGAHADEIAAMDACQEIAPEPLDWVLGLDGAFHAADARHGHWTIFPALIDA